MPRVNLAVNDERKERWDTAAKEHPEAGGNLSALVRIAVEKEISNEDTSGPVEADISPVIDAIDRLGDDMDDRFGELERRLERLEDHAEATGDLDRIAGKVIEWLPTIQPGQVGWEDRFDHIAHGDVPETYPSNDPAMADAAWTGTPEGLAKAVAYPKDLVKKALESLEKDAHIVHSVEYDGQKRWYKSGVR